MTAMRKLLSLARLGAAVAPAFPMIALSPSCSADAGMGAGTGALRLYRLPRGVRQR